MKVILSRKGFDGTSGGMPSPIMPNGDLISMPIPSRDGDSYDDLVYEDKTYREILLDLNPRFAYQTCHVDPDLDEARRRRKINGWLPAFGQSNGAATLLEKTYAIKEGDLFLFFGNFRFVERDGKGRYHYCRKGDFWHTHVLQVIWGYLQTQSSIGNQEIIARDYSWHPHANAMHLEKNTNRLFIPTCQLSFCKGKSGCGLLKFDLKRVLTAEGKSRACWKRIKAYSEDMLLQPWKNSATNPDTTILYNGRWQEKGLKDEPEVHAWAKDVVL